ncbi:recombinase RecA [Spirochaetota bacterium]
MDENKKKSLNTVVQHIEREFGKGIIMRLGDKKQHLNVDVIPSGSLGLDMALGVGGIPRGRVIEIYGPESSGKTTLALHVIAEAQKLGGVCAFVDAEHALDPAYAKKIGVDVDNLYVSQPDNGEQALDIVDSLVGSHALDIVVIDSVAALVPKSEIEGDMGEPQMGLQARLMSQALRKLTANIAKSKTSVVFINQLRQKIGVFFGNPETTTGGNALKFYSSIRLDIRKIESIKKGDEFIGSRVRVKVVKNKVAPPFKKAEFDVYYGTGIARESEILDAAVDKGFVQKSGTWYSYNDERMGQGRENVINFLKENKSVMKELESRVITVFNKESGLVNGEDDKSKKKDARADDGNNKGAASTKEDKMQTAAPGK